MPSLVNKHSRIYQLAPFLIMGIILCYSWYCFVFGLNIYSLSHILALILFLVNIFVYAIKFRIGILATGVIILLCMFNVTTIFPSTLSAFLSIDLGVRFSTPGIDLRVLLLLILYCICNSSLLFNILFEKKISASSKG